MAIQRKTVDLKDLIATVNELNKSSKSTKEMRQGWNLLTIAMLGKTNRYPYRERLTKSELDIRVVNSQTEVFQDNDTCEDPSRVKFLIDI